MVSLLVIAVTAVMVGGASLAIFTDSASNTGNTFATGTVDIALSPASALVTHGNMAPGDSVSGDLTVTNSGSLELRYAMTTTGDDASTLDEQLECTIKDSSDTVLYTGPLSGAQLGDRVLDSGDSEVLTFIVELPLDTDNDYQGQSCTVSFDFAAEQTANN